MPFPRNNRATDPATESRAAAVSGNGPMPSFDSNNRQTRQDMEMKSSENCSLKDDKSGLMLWLLPPVMAGLLLGILLLPVNVNAGFAAAIGGAVAGLAAYVAKCRSRRAESAVVAIAMIPARFAFAVLDVLRPLWLGLSRIRPSGSFSSGGSRFLKVFGMVFILAGVVGAVWFLAKAEGHRNHAMMQSFAVCSLVLGLSSGLMLWGAASLCDSVRLTRRNLAIRFREPVASDPSAFPRRPTAPSSLVGWARTCAVLGYLALALFVAGGISAGKETRSWSLLAIPFGVLYYYFWITWAEIFRTQHDTANAVYEDLKRMESTSPDMLAPETGPGSAAETPRAENARSTIRHFAFGVATLLLACAVGAAAIRFAGKARVETVIARDVPALIRNQERIPGENTWRTTVPVSQDLLSSWAPYFRVDELWYWLSEGSEAAMGDFVGWLNKRPAVVKAGMRFKVPDVNKWKSWGSPVGILEAVPASAAEAAAPEASRTSRGAVSAPALLAAAAVAERVGEGGGAVRDVISGMVSIPGKGYRMGKYEVTQAQWAAVMGNNPAKFKGADNPVENVSWNDCQEFLRKLNALPEVKASGLVFRLPTDAEWEYACRAGATGKYCKLADGTEITEDTLGRVAWYKDNSDDKTHPVGQKEPNAFGLYDMQGNVSEWTSTADGVFRVVSGGGWHYLAGGCESSDRPWYSFAVRLDVFGFRLCASGRAD